MPATDHGLTESILRAISELLSTASASATTLSLKALLYDERLAFGMMNGER